MNTIPKITLSRMIEIPFNKLILSQDNVRQVKAGISIESLAASIEKHSLLQSLSVRPVLDEAGVETGMYEVPAGGRRYRALQLLVKRKRLAKTAPIPCIVRLEGLAAEDSLVENSDREALHPLDQYRAFQKLTVQGRGEDDIAAAFGVTPAVVRQRLKLAAVSDKLLNAYAEDKMSLEQLMAFTVSDNHTRQEAVWEAVQQGWNKSGSIIRRMLNETTVPATDKRAKFIELDTYVNAGGTIIRDLFEDDHGGWLQDPVLLDRLVTEALSQISDQLKAEGWKWVTAADTLPYGYRAELRSIDGDTSLSDEETTALAALQAEYDTLSKAYEEAEDGDDAVEARLDELHEAIEAYDEIEPRFTAEEKAMAGVFVSLGYDGQLVIDAGYVKSEDEPQPDAGNFETAEADGASGSTMPASNQAMPQMTDPAAGDVDDSDDHKPLSDRLVGELTAHRTLALRNALAEDWDVAFLAVLHALCLSSFYKVNGDSCLEIDGRSTGFSMQASDLNDSVAARTMVGRHEGWAAQLPEQHQDVWAALQAFDTDSRQALFAHCAGLTVNAVITPYNRSSRTMAHADRLATMVSLDMNAAGWTPSVDHYLGRVTKPQILAAVRDAKGEAAAAPLSSLKKGEMAEAAAKLLDGCGWLPEILRTEPAPAETSAEGEAALVVDEAEPVETDLQQAAE